MSHVCFWHALPTQCVKGVEPWWREWFMHTLQFLLNSFKILIWARFQVKTAFRPRKSRYSSLLHFTRLSFSVKTLWCGLCMVDSHNRCVLPIIILSLDVVFGLKRASATTIIVHGYQRHHWIIQSLNRVDSRTTARFWKVSEQLATTLLWASKATLFALDKSSSHGLLVQEVVDLRIVVKTSLSLERHTSVIFFVIRVEKTSRLRMTPNWSVNNALLFWFIYPHFKFW